VAEKIQPLTLKFGFSTLAWSLTLWTSLFLVISLLLLGGIAIALSSYTFSGTIQTRSERTADEIQQVLIDPLYNVNDNTAVDIAEVFLRTGTLEGMVIESELSGEIFNQQPETDQFFGPITREIYGYDFNLGFVTLWFSTAELTALQRRLWITLGYLTLGLLAAILTISVFYIRLRISNSFLPVFSGLAVISSGLYNKSIPESKFSDVNTIIREINDLSSKVHMNKQELVQLNNSLEQKVEQRTRELKETSDKLRVTEKMLALGTLVAGISHELNTPLGNALVAASFMETIIADMNLNPEDQYRLKEAVDIVLTNIKRSSNLVQNFRSIALTESSEFPEKFVLNTVVENSVKTLDTQLKKRYITVEISENEVIVKSYQDAIWPIITNLLQNTMKHGYVGDGKVKISCSKSQEGINCLKYEDFGKGLSPEQQKKIFEPFYTTNRVNGGSGLGMYLLYNVVTSQLQGNLVIDTVREKGFGLEIYFPDLDLRAAQKT
jgi:signal transduction histidine kinase